MAAHHLPIYKSTYELLRVAAEITRSMPRDYKLSLGAKIQTECVDFVGHVVLPHRTRARRRLLGNALRTFAQEPLPGRRRALANSYLGLMRQGANFQSQKKLVKAARLLGHSHTTTAERIFAK